MSLSRSLIIVLIFEIADNSRLNDLIHDLYRYSKRYPAFFTDHERLEKSYAEHQLMINALKNHNTDLARVLIRTHTVDSYNHVLEQFKAKEALEAEKEQNGLIELQGN